MSRPIRVLFTATYEATCALYIECRGSIRVAAQIGVFTLKFGIVVNGTDNRERGDSLSDMYNRKTQLIQEG